MGLGDYSGCLGEWTDRESPDVLSLALDGLRVALIKGSLNRPWRRGGDTIFDLSPKLGLV